MRKSYILDHEPNPDEGTVNLTPLIDVVFVVLIMFILVAPLLELDRIRLAAKGEVKKEKTVSVNDGAPIKIHVYADNSIWLNGAPLESNVLYSHVKQLPLGTIPQIFHDREASFGTYQTVKNALESAGFEEMDVILK